MTVSDLRGIFENIPLTERYPVLFIGHGSPMNGIEDNVYARAWKKLGETLPLPRAILVISAHWLSDRTIVDVSLKPKTIYDFYGFPEELYGLKYPADGAPLFAEETEELLKTYNIQKAEYGLDHGAWIVLRRMYEKADVPVYQLSIDYTKPATYHYELGRALHSLCDHGVLIMGSGNIVHNLGVINFHKDAKAFDWAIKFDEQFKSFVTNGNHAQLLDYQSMGAEAKLAIPTPDHYFPFLYALGAGGEHPTVSFPTEGIAHGSISMRSILFS